MTAAPEAPETLPPPSDTMLGVFAQFDAEPGDQPPKSEAPPEADPAPDPAPAQDPAPAPKPEPKKMETDDLGLPKPKAKEQPKPDVSPVQPEIKGPKALREAYDKATQELTAAQARLKELEAKQKPEFNADEFEKPWREKLTAQEKRAMELEEKLKFSDYRSSQEYADKYERPIVEAHNAAKEDLVGVNAVFRDAEGNVTGQRQIDSNDILDLQRMSPAQARQVAKNAFGDNADIVLRHVDKIRDLSRSADKALNEWKQKGAEYRANEEKSRAEMQASAIRSYDETLKAITTARPDLFGPDDEIPETKEYLQKGSELVDLALRGKGLPPGLTPAEQMQALAKAQANLAARGMAYGATVARLMKATEKIEELTAKLAEYEKVDPAPKTNGDRPKTSSAGTMDDVMAQIEGAAE